jgi:hypothetical protein
MQQVFCGCSVQFSLQSMGSICRFSNSALHCENGFAPKKPRYADSGEGWGAVRTICWGEEISFFFCQACLPQSRNTTDVLRRAKALITASVKCSQPMPRCEPGWWARTVSTVFSSSTPWRAHFSSEFCLGIGNPRSWQYSRRILRNDGGAGILSGTEKARPQA